MEEKIKNTLSIFLKLAPAQINTTTVIDRSAVSSSILLHRMYAKLAAEGFVVSDYQNLRTLGDLLQRLNGTPALPTTAANGTAGQQTDTVTPAGRATQAADNRGIGIDIEMINAIPLTNDFREDSFYTMNFATKEIAHCILQPNPYASFAGLFAAKEAMVKADNSLLNQPFKDIPVLHLSSGKPWNEHFNISVSHTDTMAVAVALPIQPPVQPQAQPLALPAKTAAVPAGVWFLTVTSLLLSVIALFIILGKK